MMEAVQVSDEQREQVVRDLTRHCGDGRLTLDELEDRIAEAYAATTDVELRHSLRDLPAQPLATTTAPRPPIIPTSGPHPVRVKQHHPHEIDARRAGEIALRIHLAVYLSVIGLLVAIWFLTSPFGYPWPMWPALTWGVALAIHAGVHRAVWSGGSR